MIIAASKDYGGGALASALSCHRSRAGWAALSQCPKRPF